MVGGNDTDTGRLWQIQAGVSQNWFGIGKTVLYGEYARGDNLQRTFSTTLTSAGVGSGNEYTMWGLGVVQNIDAAALEIYLAYRRHSLSSDPAGLGAAAAGTTNLNTGMGVTSPAGATSLEDIQTIMGGMRIAF